jgi:hypothetical protein
VTDGRHRADPEERTITDSFPILGALVRREPEELAEGEVKRPGVWPVGLLLGIVLAAAVGLLGGLWRASGDSPPRPLPTAVLTSPSTLGEVNEPDASATVRKERAIPTLLPGPTVYRTAPPMIVYRDRSVPGPTVTRRPKPGPAKTIRVTVRPEPEQIRTCYIADRDGTLEEIPCP